MLQVLITGEFQYPFGSATAHRMRLYAKGLLQAGGDVRVLTQRPIALRECDKNALGDFAYANVKYETTAHYLDNGGRDLATRVSNHIQAIRKSIRWIRQLILDKAINIVVVDGLSYFACDPIVRLCRSQNVPVVVSAVEWFPANVYRGGVLNPLYWDDLLRRKWSDRLASGVILVSSYLERKYSAYGLPMLRVPHVYDFTNDGTGEFEPLSPEDSIVRLTYVGGFRPLDGAMDMLEAVKIARQHGCPVELNVVGSDGTQRISREIAMRSSNDTILRDAVRFLGRISEEQYTMHLRRSTALILLRSAGIGSEAAFPTRLTDYLASGRPVIITSVPDIPEYLSDRIHAHVVPPGEPQLVAERILEIWADPEKASALGLAGREKARICFDHAFHGRRIHDFLCSLSAPARY